MAFEDGRLPKEFVLPNWESNILTLAQALIDPSRHPLWRERLGLGEPRTILFFLIDGMNRRLVEKFSGLGEDLREEPPLTSLAPSATAAVITSIATGRAPRQHGATGWVTWCPELAAHILPLPFTYEAGGDLASCGHAPEKLFGGGPSLFEEISRASGRQCFSIMPRTIAASPFTTRMQKGARIFPSASFRNMCEIAEWIARRAAASKSGKAFVYAYSEEPDHIQHRFGLGASETQRAYEEIGKELRRLHQALAKSDAVLVAISDHGFVDCPAEEAVFVEDHPALGQTLRLPLSGEPRFAYCHLKPGKEKAFLDYVGNELGERFFAILTEEHWVEKLFGTGPEHPRFRDRIGEAILLAKGGAALYDPLASEPLKAFRGLHGSLLEEEMLLPLIVIRPGV